MNCPECNKDLIYVNPRDGKEEYFCKYCKQTYLLDPDPDKEFEDIEVDGDSCGGEVDF